MALQSNRPCPPHTEIRGALDELYRDPAFVKGMVLYADALLRGATPSSRPQYTLDGIDAEGFVAEAFLRIAAGTRRLRTRWGLDLEKALSRLVERTIRSLVSNARRHQRRSFSLMDEEGNYTYEPADERTSEIDPAILVPLLFRGDTLEDRIGRGVLELEDRECTARRLRISVRTVHRVVSERIIPKVQRALRDGLHAPADLSMPSVA